MEPHTVKIMLKKKFVHKSIHSYLDAKTGDVDGRIYQKKNVKLSKLTLRPKWTRRLRNNFPEV